LSILEQIYAPSFNYTAKEMTKQNVANNFLETIESN